MLMRAKLRALVLAVLMSAAIACTMAMSPLKKPSTTRLSSKSGRERQAMPRAISTYPASTPTRQSVSTGLRPWRSERRPSKGAPSS